MAGIKLYSDQSLPDRCRHVDQLDRGLNTGTIDDSEAARSWFLQSAGTGRGFYAVMPEGFVPRALFFDMDATFVEEETLVEIARRCGSYEQVKEITQRAMTGELDFEAALRQRIATLKNFPSHHLDAVQADMRLTPGLRELLELGLRQGWPRFLVSGGFNQLAGPLAQELGLTAFAANELGVADGKFTGTILGQVVDAQFKRAWLEKMCAAESILPEQAVAIGDGANDKAMLERAGLAVGFRPKPVLNQVLDICNHRGDHGLTAVVLDHCQR